jgi:ribosomal protein S27AE
MTDCRDDTRRGLVGATHQCQPCGYEVLLGPGHHSDFAVCTSCGADFVVEYDSSPPMTRSSNHFEFAHCTNETPGTLIWYNSEELKADDRENPIELRRDVQPLPRTEFPDLGSDVCPNCGMKGSLVLHLPERFVCPKCHQGVLERVGTWIQ